MQLILRSCIRETLSRPTLEGISCPSIPFSLKVWLEREFEEGEVRVAMLECGGGTKLLGLMVTVSLLFMQRVMI